MSNDDQYGGGAVGGTGQTRTRLPDSPSDPYGTPRRTPRASRGLITVVGVVVLLISAIAFANRSQDTPQPPPRTNPHHQRHRPHGHGPGHQGLRPQRTGRPVRSRELRGGPGFRRHVQKGHPARDHRRCLHRRSRRAPQGPSGRRVLTGVPRQTRTRPERQPAQANTFISRTVPVGTRVDSYAPGAARISVWATGLIGMSGEKSTDPVRTTWKTWVFDLVWSGDDWKIAADSQQDGPAPVPGDVPASSADDISKATKEFGGFTYAR